MPLNRKLINLNNKNSNVAFKVLYKIYIKLGNLFLLKNA